MEEGKKGAAAGVVGVHGGAAVVAAEGSPALPNRALRAIVSKSVGMAVKGRQRRTRRGTSRGQRMSRAGS
jgi:hypothetical protein